MARRLPLILWLAACAGFLAWVAQHAFHVGRMPLPRDQALAIAGCIVVALTLAAAWVALLARWLARRVGWAGDRAFVERPVVRVLLIASLPLAAATGLYGRYVEPRWLAVRPLALGLEAPTGRRAIRIAVISDLHIDGPGTPWSELPAAVNAADPDVVLFLGDALNRRDALPLLHRTLRQIRARHAKLAVRGNWEAWYHGALPLLQGTGFAWLDDRRTLTVEGQRLHLVGLSYRDGERGARAERLLAAAPRPGWRIFLYHTPDLALAVPSADLYLAGHTHGGQIALPFFGALVTLSRYGKRFERGLHRVGHTAIYVNPGIGIEPMVPLRIGVRPEVTLLRLGTPPPRDAR
jgi:hypothetical protein